MNTTENKVFPFHPAVHFGVLLVHPGWIEYHMGVAKLYTHFRVCKANN
jgi:hypothetical protein